MTYLSDISQVESLRQAFNHVARGRLGRPSGLVQGIDGISINSFAENIDSKLLSLAKRLRADSFQFSQLKPIILHDPIKNKRRIICVPTVADRVVQRAILNSIAKSQNWLFNDISYGFIPKTDELKGVVSAVKKAKELRGISPWIFKTDIQKFFDRVNRLHLEEEIRRKIKQRSIHNLLKQAMHCEIKLGPRSESAQIKQAGIKFGEGVRQGMPLSPFFANLMLADFDKYCIKSHIKAIRYADDLIFFCQSKDQAIAIYQECKERLARLDLSIPDIEENSKSVIASPDDSVSFLGVELAPDGKRNYSLRVGDKQFLDIKGSFYNLCGISELKSKNLTLGKLQSALHSKKNAYIACYDYCDNIQDLETQMEHWVNGVIKKVLNNVGISVATLNTDAQWLLGLR
nr:reverse transcriptase domain-containing protein [Delftia acidovorans]